MVSNPKHNLYQMDPEQTSSIFSPNNLRRIKNVYRHHPVGVLVIRTDNLSGIVGLKGPEIGIRLMNIIEKQAVGAFYRYFEDCLLMCVETSGVSELYIGFQISEMILKNFDGVVNQYRVQMRNGLKDQVHELVTCHPDILVGSTLLNTDRKRDFHSILFQAVCEAQWSANYRSDPQRHRQYTEFIRILEEPLLECYYQPIVNLQNGAILGWEAKTHGPAGSEFYNVNRLYEYADRIGKAFMLDVICQKLALKTASLVFQGDALFLKAQLRAVNDKSFQPDMVYSDRDKGLQPSKIVLQFNESRCIAEPGLMYSNLSFYRHHGHAIALDHVGGGRSMFTSDSISKIQPDYMIIDSRLIEGIEYQPIKRAAVENLVVLAEQNRCKLIAKGINRTNELKTLATLGVLFGQGDLLFPPQRRPAGEISIPEDLKIEILGSNRVKYSTPIIFLVKQTLTASPQDTVESTGKLMSEDLPMTSVVIVEDGSPVGLLMKYHMDHQLGKRFGVSLFYHRKVQRLMDTAPLIVASDMPLDEVAKRAMSRDPRKIYDDIIVIEQGILKGTVSVQTLLETMAKVAETEGDKARADNKKIRDSLRYAKLIQESILPDVSLHASVIPDSFYIWMPKDIVGGDIFFIEKAVSGLIIAVIDCTGHGVPAAFMTMIACAGIKRIIKDEGCYRPHKILKRLNQLVKETLKQDSRTAVTDDGLDAAVCLIDAEKRSLEFSGARLPLLCLHNDQVNVIKGDRKSIGYVDSDIDYEFSIRSQAIKPGMAFYMYTDGYVDQLGGTERLPLGSAFFRKLLLDNYRKPFDRQKEILVETFENHKAGHDRQDDVTVFGFGFQ